MAEKIVIDDICKKLKAIFSRSLGIKLLPLSKCCCRKNTSNHKADQNEVIMYIPIENMPASSRIWIYQADRQFEIDEERFISEKLKSFCHTWAAHGQDLQTSFDINNNRFVILVINESAASPSGCSIDSSSHVIRGIGSQLEIDFFNRAEVPFIETNAIVTYPFLDLKRLFQDGILNEGTQTFNTLATTLGEWRQNGKPKAEDTWLKRYIPKIAAS
jgi:hypothetical protein